MTLSTQRPVPCEPAAHNRDQEQAGGDADEQGVDEAIASASGAWYKPLVASAGRLPSGTVTFLFTDMEGSTELLKRLGRDRYESVLAEQAGVLRAAVAAHGGQVVDTQGDSLFCAFRSAREGVSAAIEAQRELALHEWPEQVRVRVRMGLHSGEPKAGEERYVGIGVHRAARIGAAAHGGQVLVSETARALVSDDLPAGVSLRDLGVHRLKDIDEPVRLYQVVAAGLEDRFPAPRTCPRPQPSRPPRSCSWQLWPSPALRRRVRFWQPVPLRRSRCGWSRTRSP